MFKVVFFISLKLDQILKVNLDYLNFCSNIIFAMFLPHTGLLSFKCRWERWGLWC